MPLQPGARVGPYEVTAKLGEGGMGEVYRARDHKLERDVAIKILPDAFAHDAERLARFEREAKTLASLNHPQIAHVYGFEQSGATHALVMELVEGEDLSARVRRGPLPLDEALPIARQIADALEAAHEAGIVHRDLKPANVKVRNDGTVKVLDFGLAKAFEQGSGIGDQGSGSLANSPTITSPAMTMRGVILGTAAYMSPEQAKGRFVDKRADIWAFGCVVYEMLTGKRAFDGDDVSDTLASVLRAEPDWSALSSASTPAIATVVRRCLVRDPRQRIRDAGDVRLQLEEAHAAKPDHTTASASPRRWIPALIAAAAAVTVLAVAVPAVWRPPPAEPEVLRFSVTIPEEYRIHRLGNVGRMSFSLSPDGRSLAAVLASARTGRRVFVRRLDEIEFREVSGIDDAFAVIWAADSNRFAVVATSGVRFMSLSGGSSMATVVLDAYGPLLWMPDDMLVAFGGPGQQLRRWKAGGQPAPGAASESGTPIPADLLPDGGLLVLRGAPPTTTLVAETARGSTDVMTLDVAAPGAATALYRDGQLLLSRVERSGRSSLTAQQFDPATGMLSGQQTAIASGINQAISASNTGILAFAQAEVSAQEIVWLDERGTLASRVLNGTNAQNIDLSPDDRMLVLQDDGAVRLHDMQRGVTTTLASAGADPVWSGDGRQVAFVINTPKERGIYVMSANGGASQQVYPSTDPIYIDGWSLDGKWIAAHTNRVISTTQKGEGFLIPLAPGGKPVVFADTTDERAVDEARFSPDGRWLAYGLTGGLTGTDSGEVFLMPLPPTGERWQVSVNGGAQPRWSGDGRSLFYLALDGNLMRVDVAAATGTSPTISAPRPMFQTGVDVALNVDQYAVSRDGKRFLLRRPQVETGREEIQLIVNWPKLLKGQ